MGEIAPLAAMGYGTFVLRPGVEMPAWSFVTDPAAREALAAGMAAARRAEKWSGLGATEDRVWRAVLLEFAYSGRAPDTVRLASVTGLHGQVVAAVLRTLCGRDLLVLDTEGGTVRVAAAYPFCAWATEHQVRFTGMQMQVGCLCAIDALGAGAMLGRDTEVSSSCRACGAPVRIATRSAGRALRSVTPAGTVVWSGIRYVGGCCATSGCAVKAFFCSDEHLTAWREQADPSGVGFRLSIEAALQVGKALFVPMLAESGAAGADGVAGGQSER